MHRDVYFTVWLVSIEFCWAALITITLDEEAQNILATVVNFIVTRLPSFPFHRVKDRGFLAVLPSGYGAEALPSINCLIVYRGDKTANPPLARSFGTRIAFFTDAIISYPQSFTSAWLSLNEMADMFSLRALLLYVVLTDRSLATVGIVFFCQASKGHVRLGNFFALLMMRLVVLFRLLSSFTPIIWGLHPCFVFCGWEFIRTDHFS